MERLVDGREQVHRLPSSRSPLLRLRHRCPRAPAGEAPPPDLRRPAPPPPHLPQRPRGHRPPRTEISEQSCAVRSPDSREWEQFLGKQLTLLLLAYCHCVLDPHLRATWRDKLSPMPPRFRTSLALISNCNLPWQLISLVGKILHV